MPVRVVFTLLALTIFDVQGKPQQSAAQVSIVGTVVDSRGAPVPGALVRVFPFASYRGYFPNTTTDSQGSFVLKLSPFGPGVVSAYKPSSGFPDAEMALYGKWAYPSVAQVDAEPGSTIRVSLRFGEPDAVIEWNVASKKDQSPLSDVQFEIEWSDNPNIMASFSSKTGSLTFVLPKHPVVVRITAKGFKDWNSSDRPAFGRPILFRPGTVDKRLILLEPK